MNPNDIRNVAIAATGAVTVGFATINYLKIRRQEIAKRQVIRKQSTLDLIAIQRAAAIMEERIDDREFKSLSELAAAFNNEVAFQKIAVREF